MNSEHYIDGQHNGGVLNHFNSNPYSYCYQNPVRLIDPNGKQVDVVVESGNPFVVNVGHTYVSLGSNTNNPVIYTYGRYAHLDKNKGPLNATNISGEGILIKLEGDEAIKFNKKYVNENSAKVYNIANSDENKVRAFFEDKLKQSKGSPDIGKYKGKDNAKVIDKYQLFSNNCTTISIEAIESGIKDKKIEYLQFNGISGTYFKNEVDTPFPYALNIQLKDATKTNNNIKEVTEKYKNNEK